MNTKYTYDTKVLATDIDLGGRCSPYSVFSIMQQLADMHAEELGLSRFYLLEKGLVWIIARARLHMLRYPGAYDRLSATTYYGSPSRLGFHRYYEFNTPDGELLGRASNLWLLVDAQTHRIVSPLKAGMFFPEDDVSPELRLDTNKLSFEGEITSTVERNPVYSDYDINGHVNNARYIQWICDALPLDAMKNNMLHKLEINYIAEVRQGEQVQIELANAVGNGSGSAFMIRGAVAGEARFVASGSLKAE